MRIAPDLIPSWMVWTQNVTLLAMRIAPDLIPSWMVWTQNVTNSLSYAVRNDKGIKSRKFHGFLQTE